MNQIAILSISLAVQIVAAILALRLIPVTGRRLAWLALAAALGLMCVRRAISLQQLIMTADGPGPASVAEIVALTISVLMLLAVLAIEPVFKYVKSVGTIESRFGRVLDSTLHEIYIFDAESLRFQFVNRGARSNLGYTMEELRKMTPADLKPEFDEARFREMLEPLRQRELPRKLFATRHRREDGTEYLVEVDLQLSSEGDEPTYVAVIQDVSERVSIKNELVEREAHFRALIENVHDVVTELSEGGRILYQSPSVERVLGFCAAEHDGTNAFGGIHPSDQDKFSEFLRRLWEDGAPISAVYRVRHKDGSWRTMEAAGSVRAAADGARSLVLNQRDVTDREIAESRLRQTQKMETIGTLAGGIAHDFNNLLTTILGFAELLKKDSADAQSTTYADEIYFASCQAQQLVRQILTFSRQGDFVRRNVDLLEIVDNSSRLVRSTLPASVEFETDIEVDLATVLADPTQVQQVLMNLCTNSHQALQPDGGKILVRLRREEIPAGESGTPSGLAPGTYFRLTVSDNGLGIDPTTLERVFEPFFTTKESREGTGLGLSVAHGIMVDHEGNLVAESEPGKGSSFHAWFPEAIGASVADDTRAGHEEFEHVGASERIMIVDDNRAAVSLLSTILGRSGYDVRAYTDPNEARARLQAAPDDVDLLITDKTMPGMNGLQLAAAARDLNSSIAIMLISGFSDDVDASNAAELNISSVIEKPFTAADLCHEVRIALDDREEQSAGRTVDA